MASKLELFDLAGCGRFRGYDRPDLRWNGWHCPVFPVDTVKQIARLLDRDYLPGNDMPSLRIVQSEIRTTIYFVDDQHRFQEIRPVDDDQYGEPVYDIGSFGWCWDLIPEVISIEFTVEELDGLHEVLEYAYNWLVDHDCRDEKSCGACKLLHDSELNMERIEAHYVEHLINQDS